MRAMAEILHAVEDGTPLEPDEIRAAITYKERHAANVALTAYRANVNDEVRTAETANAIAKLDESSKAWSDAINAAQSFIESLRMVENGTS